MREMSRQVRDVRSQMEEDENLKVLMASLRGQNLSDADFADESVQMRLVEVDMSADEEGLPLVYDPDTIEEYWGRRPVAVVSRILQLLGEIACGFRTFCCLADDIKSITLLQLINYSLPFVLQELLVDSLLGCCQILSLGISTRTRLLVLLN